MVLEKILEYSLDCKEIKPFNPKGNQSKYSLKGLMLKFQCFGHLMQVKVKSLSRVWLFATPRIAAYQASPSMDFRGKGTGVGCHCLPQGIFPTRELNPGLPHCRQTLYPLKSGKSLCKVNWLEKTLMLGKTEGQRRRGRPGEMVGWRHWLNGHEFEQAPDDGDGQGNRVCCSPWGHKKSDTTELLSNNNNFLQLAKINVSLS